LIDGRDRFEPEIHVFSPPGDAFRKTLDEEYTRNLCERIGVPVARGMVLGDFLWHRGPWTYDDTFLWCDPKPYLAERLDMVTGALRRAKGKRGGE
jgi:hypothetical protein